MENRGLSTYERYALALDKLCLSYRGYNLRHVLAYDFATVIYGKQKLSLKTFARFILLRAYRGLENCVADNGILSTLPFAKNEWYEILNYVLESSGIDRFLDISKSGWRICFNAKNIYSSLNQVVKIPGLNFSERIQLWAAINYRLNLIDYIDSLDMKHCRGYLAFCSVVGDEAVLVEYFKARKVPTFSLQHGTYVFNTGKNKTADCLNFENFHADYLLCWGEATKQEFLQYGSNERSLLVSGYPRYLKKINSMGRDSISDCICVLILCARQEFDRKNIKIFEIVKEFVTNASFPVIVKVRTHPSLDQVKYRELAKQMLFEVSEGESLSQLFANPVISFVVTYNSTVYYEAYLNGVFALRYSDEDDELHDYVMDDAFSDVDELNSRVRDIRSLSGDPRVLVDIEKRLEYLVGYGINSYKANLLGNVSNLNC